jgi:leader peptidase (prepilin peptidase)/N-methyltransferase
MIDWLASHPAWLFGLLGILGLMVGSFLNVVILRLPRILEQRWDSECRAFLAGRDESAAADESTAVKEEDAPLSLSFPPSHCPQCRHPIRPWHNVPVVGWLWLRGRCPDCTARISPRYPIIEAFTAIASVCLGLRFGVSAELLGALLLTWALIALAVIDFDTQLLPDDITLPLLWGGLLFHLLTGLLPLADVLIGAMAGYLLLWSLYWAFKLLTGKEGMGYGDFKLLAALGAWLGWQSLPLIILLSSLLGAVVGIALMLLTRRGRDVPIPYGPWLAAAGWIALLWGDALTALWLGGTGTAGF